MDRLDLLAASALGISRTNAKKYIENGCITVNGVTFLKAGEKIAENAVIKCGAPLPVYVSRGGDKLAKALSSFQIDVAGKVCLDVGSSTGGFTDCLLRHGAAFVYAVDNGKDQLSEKLRNDRRVCSMESTNIVSLTNGHFEREIEFATVDVSFVSITKVLRPVFEIIKPGCGCVCLIKPQFEAGRSSLNKKGIVTSLQTHMDVLQSVTRFMLKNGAVPVNTIFSPITGGDGNTEYLIHLKVERP